MAHISSPVVNRSRLRTVPCYDRKERRRSSLTDQRIVRTRAALAQAVIAIAAERDFGEVTIAEIAERAGIGYATFFRHYRDKEELLADVADSLVSELLLVIVPTLMVDDTARASRELCAFVDARRPIC